MKNYRNEGPGGGTAMTAALPPLLVGVLPGPVNGMTLVNQRVVDACAEAGPISVVDLGRFHHRASNRKAWLAIKAVATLASILPILRARTRNRAVYIVSNSGAALWLTLAQIAASRFTGLPTYLHHHTTASLTKMPMKLIGRVGGSHVTHIVSCHSLEEVLRSTIGDSAPCSIFKPTVVLDPSAQPRGGAVPAAVQHRPFTLGHLSNLTVSKGLGRAIDVHRKLAERGYDVRSVIAGKAMDLQEERLIVEAQAHFGDDMTFLGPVYGQEKEAFFQSIDAFVFPSYYANESWAIVLDEALVAGVPVLTTTFPGSERVGGGSGLEVADGADFVSTAVRQLAIWIDEYETFQSARVAAAKVGAALVSEAQDELLMLARTLVLDETGSLSEVGR